MRIVYGLSGEGHGHSSIARQIIPILIRQGHEVKVITYGLSLRFLKEYNPIEIKGIVLYYEKNHTFSLRRTIFNNLDCLSFYVKNWRRIRNELKAFSPDLFIVNFEPLTALLAHSLRKPLISLSNQHGLLYFKEEIPKKYRKSFFITKIAIALATPFAEKYVIMSLTDLTINKKNVRIITPIIHENIKKLKPRKGKKILVYLKNPNFQLLETLKKLDEEFIVYGRDIKKKDGNLVFRKTGNSFIKDLQNCKAIIATAGQSLITEAIYLKKPFFGVPPEGEFEQTFNAMLLKKSHFGNFSENPSEKEINHFIKNLSNYEKELKKFKFEIDKSEKEFLEVIEEIENRTKSRRH